MTLRDVKVLIDGKEVGVVRVDLEPQLDAALAAQGYELAYEGESLLSSSGHVDLEGSISPDDWARLTEHSVFSDEPGKP